MSHSCDDTCTCDCDWCTSSRPHDEPEPERTTMTESPTDLIQRYAAEIERIIDAGTAADHTWVGLLSAFMQEYAGDPVPAPEAETRCSRPEMTETGPFAYCDDPDCPAHGPRKADHD